MNKVTSQMREWQERFGHDYTDRNALSVQELNALYQEQYGITRTEMNSMFVDKLDRDIRILEVGSNIGNQLLLLQQAGFKNLFGIELQSYAVEMSKHNTKNINIIEGSAFDIPFKDDFFDLVFTSGLLIHIAPGDLGVVMDEIVRCAKRYIWCFEYYSDVCKSIKYREHAELLWSADFSSLLISRFHGLNLVREEHFGYLTTDDVSTMFILEKNKNRGEK